MLYTYEAPQNLFSRPEMQAALEKVGAELFLSAHRTYISDKAISAAEYLQRKGVFNAD